jgi:hypothetical protein
MSKKNGRDFKRAPFILTASPARERADDAVNSTTNGCPKETTVALKLWNWVSLCNTVLALKIHSIMHIMENYTLLNKKLPL